MRRRAVVSREEWLVARKTILAREKEFTRLRDRLSAERRALPWVRIDKPYVFDAPQGKRTLAELFDGRPQLIVYHLMFGPGWKEGARAGLDLLVGAYNYLDLAPKGRDEDALAFTMAWVRHHDRY
jgi:predicted dithiol-disulfide oxidoreductase (DUF899 family)